MNLFCVKIIKIIGFWPPIPMFQAHCSFGPGKNPGLPFHSGGGLQLPFIIWVL
jgi:hypothetical protein